MTEYKELKCDCNAKKVLCEVSQESFKGTIRLWCKCCKRKREFIDGIIVKDK